MWLEEEVKPSEIKFEEIHSKNKTLRLARRLIRKLPPPFSLFIFRYESNGTIYICLKLQSSQGGKPIIEKIRAELRNNTASPEPVSKKIRWPWSVGMGDIRLEFHLHVLYGCKNIVWRMQCLLELMQDYIDVKVLARDCKTMLNYFFRDAENEFANHEKGIYFHSDNSQLSKPQESRGRNIEEARVLRKACIRGDYETLFELLRNGADPNTNITGGTVRPIMFTLIIQVGYNRLVDINEDIQNRLRMLKLLLEYGADPNSKYFDETILQGVLKRAELFRKKGEVYEKYFKEVIRILTAPRTAIPHIYVHPENAEKPFGELILQRGDVIRQRLGKTQTIRSFDIWREAKKTIGVFTLRNGEHLTWESKLANFLNSEEHKQVWEIFKANFTIPGPGEGNHNLEEFKKLLKLKHMHVDHLTPDEGEKVIVDLIRNADGEIVAFALSELIYTKNERISKKPVIINYMRVAASNLKGSQYGGIVKLIILMRGFAMQGQHPNYEGMSYFEAASMFGYGIIDGIGDYYPKYTALCSMIPFVMQKVDPEIKSIERNGIYYIKDPLQATKARKSQQPEWPTLLNIIRDTYCEKYETSGYDLIVTFLNSPKNFMSWAESMASIIARRDFYKLLKHWDWDLQKTSKSNSASFFKDDPDKLPAQGKPSTSTSTFTCKSAL